MSVFHRVYKWMSQYDERTLGLVGDQVDKTFDMPGDIRGEFVAAAAHVLFAEADLRAQVSTRIACTDATPTRGGVVSCRVLRPLAESLFDRGILGGFRTRLDWQAGDYEALSEEWRRSAYTAVDVAKGRHNITDILDAASWEVDWEDNFKETSHVNLQEALGVKKRLTMAVNESVERIRIVTFSDSWVVIGAWGKGRSSSLLLNGILRSCVGWQILGRLDMVCIYCPTAFNPADDPSRAVPLRLPKILSLLLPSPRCCVPSVCPPVPPLPALLLTPVWYWKFFKELGICRVLLVT
jgi:hypothetical protein